MLQWFWWRPRNAQPRHAGRVRQWTLVRGPAWHAKGGDGDGCRGGSGGSARVQLRLCVGGRGGWSTTRHATWPNARAGHVSWPSDHAAVRVRLAPALSIRTNLRGIGRRRRLSLVAAASLRAHGATISVLCVQTLDRRCHWHCDRTRGGTGRLIRKKAGGDRGPEGSHPPSAEWRSLRFHCVRSSARTPHAGPQYM